MSISATYLLRVIDATRTLPECEKGRSSSARCQINPTAATIFFLDLTTPLTRKFNYQCPPNNTSINFGHIMSRLQPFGSLLRAACRPLRCQSASAPIAAKSPRLENIFSTSDPSPVLLLTRLPPIDSFPPSPVSDQPFPPSGQLPPPCAHLPTPSPSSPARHRSTRLPPTWCRGRQSQRTRPSPDPVYRFAADRGRHSRRPAG